MATTHTSSVLERRLATLSWAHRLAGLYWPRAHPAIRNTLRMECASTLLDPAIQEALAESTVDFGAMGREPQTIYLVLPGHLMEVYSRWVRLMVMCALAEIEAAGIVPVGPGGERGPSIYFQFEEFASMGDVPCAMARMRKHGFKAHLILQSLSQLEGIYGARWKEIIGNTAILQFFGGSPELSVCEYFSKLSGQRTRVSTQTNVNTKADAGVGTNWGTYGQPLILPDQVARLPLGEQLIYISGHGMAKCRMLNPNRNFDDTPEFQAYLQWKEARNSGGGV